MQTGDGLVKPPAPAAPRNYTVTWNIDTGQMSYQDGTGPVTDFPVPPESLPISPGDTVVFAATSHNQPPLIEIPFVPNLGGRAFPSPFSFSYGTVPVDVYGNVQPANPTPSLGVIDGSDAAGTVFTFTVKPADGSTPSNPYNLKL